MTERIGLNWFTGVDAGDSQRLAPIQKRGRFQVLRHDGRPRLMRSGYGRGALSLAVPPIANVSRNSRLNSEAAAEFLTSSSPSLRAA